MEKDGMAKLYEHTKELQAVFDAILEAGGEINEAMEAALDDATEAFDQKLERVALYCRQLKLDAEQVGEEAKRLTALKKQHTSAYDGLREYMRLQLRAVGKERVEGLIKVRRQASTPRAHSTVDASTLPDHLRRKVPAVPEHYVFDSKRAVEVWKAREAGDPEAPGLPEGVTIEVGEHVVIW